MHSEISRHTSERYFILQMTFALAFLALCALFWPFTADDAYIVGRYASNAAAGNGLVYNIGEQISALTSPLHAIFETGLALLGLDPVASYRILSPFMVLLGWFVAARETKLQGNALVIFSVLGLLSPFLALWAVGGLETPMLSLLSILFVSRLISLSQSNVLHGKDIAWLSFVSALMFLTRYDSALVTAPILLAIGIYEIRRPAVWLAGLLGAAVVSTWLLFSANYYGDIFPTSFYIKFGTHSRQPIDSLSALVNFLALSGFVLFLFQKRSGIPKQQNTLPIVIGIGAALSICLFFLYASLAAGQHMMFGFRLFVPYIMSIALLISSSKAVASRIRIFVLLAFQAIMIAVVNFVGINPAPLAKLPGLNQAFTEYEFITPKAYGRFMNMLEEDAKEISRHWQASGLQEQPKIYLRTGGTGYWLPDFYVYETLISYRHACRKEPLHALIAASHYVQQLGISGIGTLAERIARMRNDIDDNQPLLFATTIDWSGPSVSGFLFGPEPTPLHLGSHIDSECQIASQP